MKKFISLLSFLLIFALEGSTQEFKDHKPSFIGLSGGFSLAKCESDNLNNQGFGVSGDANIQGAWFFIKKLGVGANIGISKYNSIINTSDYTIGLFLNVPLINTFSFTSHFLFGLMKAAAPGFSIEINGNENIYDSGSGGDFIVLPGIGLKEVFMNHLGIGFDIDYVFSSMLIFHENLTIPGKGYEKAYTFQSFNLLLNFSYVF